MLGAFCSVDWGKRPAKQAYFGTGESFVCKLLPTCCCYPWIGLELGENTPHSAHLFLLADSSHISIGGGFVIHCCNFWLLVIFSARQHAERAICYRPSVCRLSVHLSVRPSHWWISRKRLKLGSCNFHHTVAPSL